MSAFKGRIHLYHVIFAVFFICLLLQFKYVWIYFDDYGYLSLSYPHATAGVTGNHYTFSQIFRFLENHYEMANGRLICIFVLTFLHMAGGIKLLKGSMAVIISAIFYLVFLFIKKNLKINKTEADFLALFLTADYGFISQSVHQVGTYWYSAAFIYYLPAVWFLLYAFLFRGEKIWQKAACIFLAFLTAWSQEQWYIAGVLLTGLMLVEMKIQKRKIGPARIAAALVSVAGGLPVFLCPAVHTRLLMDTHKSYLAMTFPEKTGFSLRLLMSAFFTDNMPYIIWYLILMSVLGIYLFRKDRGVRQIVHGAVIITSALWIVLVLSHHVEMKHDLLQAVPAFLFLLMCFAETLWYFVREKRFIAAEILFAAYNSVGCMLFVPDISARCLLPFILLNFLFAGSLLTDLYRDLGKPAMSLLMIAVVLFGGQNARTIWHGYKKNYTVQMQNDTALKDLSERLKSGEHPGKILLKKLPDDLYASNMMYQKGFEYIVTWVQEYYDIPEGTMVYEWTD